jgi:hypothetical protein
VHQFADRLDSVIDHFVQTAAYRIRYYRRFAIKPWPYASIVPLDAIGDDYGGHYLSRHREKLSRIKPTPSFMRESDERCENGCALYRYKNKIYGFNFAICSDHSTGTWACWRATEVLVGKVDPHTNWGYLDWPTEFGTKLHNVPKSGADIPAAEYAKHREAYSALLRESKFMVKEGDYMYQGVTTSYR